ncbi:MAG: arginine--tRNA ligase [Parcubacteria group bacterium]|nr:arginine--tRNA ligase [Parcubacteria group bacterium]
MKEKISEFLKRQYPGIAFDVSYPPEGLGDYSTNIAFLLSKSRRLEISAVAEEVIEKLKNEFLGQFEKIEIAKNGFINFYLAKEYLWNYLSEISKSENIDVRKYRYIDISKSLHINLEFVSANPTGPLTLGNARSAAYGGALANILEKAGHKVTREYYINDVGNQVELLAESVKKRLQELAGERVDFPEDLYQGDYIIDLAKEAKKEKIPPERLKEFAVEKNLSGIKKSLAGFGVKFDVWFKESSLKESDEVKSILTHLEHSGWAYKKDGAVWFKGTEFGLDKDVVLVRSNGQGTYLLSDFAYAKNKLSRNFDISIYLLGADHHDDVKRLKAGIKALGLPEEKFLVLLHQLVALKKGEEVLRMAKRKGIYVTLDDLLSQIPKDVARYFFLEKSLDTHLEFNLELAKEESIKNPVYYIQYAFARINSVFQKSQNLGISKSQYIEISKYYPELLKEKEELDLLRHLIRFPEVVLDIARNISPSRYVDIFKSLASPPVHHLPQYAFELASRFHKFYEKHRIVSEDEKLSSARLSLVKAVHNVLGESLRLMGLSTPEKM